MDKQPFVSIIVPVYNEALRLPRLLVALARQTYPRECFEVIVVDNGSVDGTLAILEGQRDLAVRVVRELAAQGPDAARNTGMRGARGEVFAFTDADCRPAPDWLAQGVRALAMRHADLVAGDVRFTFAGRRPSAAEAYDAVSFLQHHDSAERRGIAFTANLFVRRAVFRAVGDFPADDGWNGDARFTAAARARGFSLQYAAAAVVSHPARPLRPLVRKAYRIGFGKGRCRDGGRAAFFGEDKPHLRHLSLPALTRSLRAKGLALGPLATAGAWLAGVAVAAAGAAGFACGRLGPKGAGPRGKLLAG